MRPRAQELIDPAVEMPTDEFGDDVGPVIRRVGSRGLLNSVWWLSCGRTREPVLACGQGHTIYARSKGFGGFR
jgi:hypothetical protein